MPEKLAEGFHSQLGGKFKQNSQAESTVNR